MSGAGLLRVQREQLHGYPIDLQLQEMVAGQFPAGQWLGKGLAQAPASLPRGRPGRGIALHDRPQEPGQAG
ncbi:hypothetical protein D3C83_00140 [compost metagenome]